MPPPPQEHSSYTYRQFTNIPPPPLSESRHSGSSTTTTTTTKQNHHTTTRHHLASTPLITRTMMSSRQSEAKGDQDVPPLAVYHICCICKRTRSGRYHREHPIPIDGLPPPGGICRRCRLVEVEDRKPTVDIVEEGRSNGIRIGLASFVPEEDIVTSEEFRRRRAQRVCKEAERLEFELVDSTGYQLDQDVRSGALKFVPPIKTREGVSYRHVREPELPQPPQPLPGFAAIETREGVIYREVRESKAPEVNDDKQQAIGNFRRVTIPPPPPSEEEPDVVAMVTRVQAGSYHNRTSNSSVTQAPSTLVSKTGSSKTSYTKSEIRRLARKEVEKSESEIRRLAREEVEKYRRVERKLEAHKDPYAHGRMVEVPRVPVERRIEQEKDIAAELPWTSSKTAPRKDSDLVTVEAVSSSDDWNAQVMQQSHLYVPRNSRQTPPSVSSTASLSSVAASDKTRKPVHDRTRYVYRQVPARGQPAIYSKAESVSATNDEKLPERVDELHREHSRQGRDQTQPRMRQVVAYHQHRVDDASEQAPASDMEVKAAQAKAEKEPAPIPESRDRVRSPDREYEYRRRVVTPVLQPREAAPLYEETNEYYSCRDVPQSPGDAEAGARSRVESIRRRISDASSRVHFSKKLDISPTPPESDANSSEFRHYRGRQQVSLEVDKDARGNDRRDQTAKPVGRQHKDIQSSELDASGSNIPPPHPLSESPTREQQMAKSRRDGYGPYVEAPKKSASLNVEDGSRKRFRSMARSAHDGYGPYVSEEKRSASVDVEDGSTIASVSWHSSEDDRYRYERRRGGR